MSDLNKVTVQGRIVRNAEFTTTESGIKMARFAIATNRYRKNPDGTPGEEAFFFPIVIFGKYAETLEAYLFKGQQMIVDGYLRQNRWEKDGEKHSEIAIGVKEIHLIFSGKKDEQNSGDLNGNTSVEVEVPPSENESFENTFEEDIPF